MTIDLLVLLERFSGETRLSVAKDSVTPLNALEMLAKDENSAVRLGVAQHPSISQELLTRLAEDESGVIRNCVASRSERPDVLSRLSQDDDPAVRAEIASNPATSEETLLSLTGDACEHTRYRLVHRNPDLSLALLEKLAHDEAPLIRSMIAKRRETPSEILSELAKDEDRNVRAAAASNKNISPGVLAELAEDEDFFVRIYVAGNSRTPPGVLERLVQDDSAAVHMAAICNASIPAEVLLRLASDSHELFTLLRATTIGSVVSREVLEKLLLHEEEWVRQAAEQRIAEYPARRALNVESMPGSRSRRG
ncbi:MAG: hypothetical protein Q7R48_00070 [bacterium]|nr:hypothetical protein [bacterium]